MVETRSNADVSQSAAAAAYDEDVANMYAAMGNSRAMNASNTRSFNPANAPTKAPAKHTIPTSLQDRPKPSLVPAKAKMSLINNRNKHDHIQQLLCGVNKPAAGAEVKKPSTATSAYRMNFVHEEEAKEMVANVD